MGRTAGISWWPLEPRVDAGMKELNEMTIGRTDDPENPFGAPAFEAADVFVGVDGPRRHRCARMRSLLVISDKGDRP
jgi:hypothetical protein